MSFNMMAKNERQEVIDLLLYGKESKPIGLTRSYFFYLTKDLPVRSTSHSKFYKGIKKTFPDAELIGLMMSTCTRTALVAKQFYFCGQAETTIQMTRVLTSKDLPLLISEEFHPVAMDILMKRLKGIKRMQT
ncbi:MAG: hypothetical protein NT096_00160 [Proteobacteria bacterium]|nr:hypothetical protein [Pseudomonadota bacterium]